MVATMKLIALLGTALVVWVLTSAANDWGIATFGLVAWMVVSAALGVAVGFGVVGLFGRLERSIR
jgi:hypothetical protein